MSDCEMAQILLSLSLSLSYFPFLNCVRSTKSLLFMLAALKAKSKTLLFSLMKPIGFFIFRYSYPIKSWGDFILGGFYNGRGTNL